MRINKFISRAGVCSRRKAEELILGGEIYINGSVVKNLATCVCKDDVVAYKGKVLKIVEKYEYFLLNKPANCIVTCFDGFRRRTVFDIVKFNSRIFPVGRLDRNTTGLLLLTNDGDLAKKLLHPSYKITKKYSILLDKPLSLQNEKKMIDGVILEDGFFRFDKVFVYRDRHKVEVSMHSGRNRIIRRMVAFLGYRVINLDRFFYCGLSKNGLKIGEYRKLKEDEVRKLRKEVEVKSNVHGNIVKKLF